MLISYDEMMTMVERRELPSARSIPPNTEFRMTRGERKMKGITKSRTSVLTSPAFSRSTIGSTRKNRTAELTTYRTRPVVTALPAKSEACLKSPLPIQNAMVATAPIEIPIPIYVKMV